MNSDTRSNKLENAGKSAPAGEEDDQCIEGHVWYIDQIAYSILNYIYFSILITSVRWLTTVFARLSHACDDCLSNVSITCACKIDLCNPKKKQNPLQHLNWIHSDSFKHCLNIIMFMTGTNNIMI